MHGTLMTEKNNKRGRSQRGRLQRHDETVRANPDVRENLRSKFYEDVARAEQTEERETLPGITPWPQHDAHVKAMRADPDFTAKRQAQFTDGIDAARKVRDGLRAQADPLGQGLSERAQERRQRAAIKSTAAHKRTIASVNVDNPYRPGETERVAKYTDVTIADQMHKRKQIDDAQKRAFDWFLGVCLRMSASGGAIDPARIRVDQSGAGDPFPQMIDAAREYRRLSLSLGAIDTLLLTRIVIDGLTIEEAASTLQVALKRGDNARTASKRQIDRTGARFREALTVIAEYKGFLGETPGGARRIHPYNSGPPVGVDESQWESHFLLVEELAFDNLSG